MSNNLTVLYVEDEDDIREMIEFALEDEGFVLIQCVSGQDAIEKAANAHPDLMLLDVMMPGMDGVSTAQKLRDMPHLANVPLIFMTAKVQQSEVEKYKAMGAIGVIKKPFDAMELPDQIRELLESAND